MDSGIKKFTFHLIRMKHGFIKGMELSETGLTKPQGESSGLFFSNQFDSGVRGNDWGRLTLNMEVPKDGQVFLYVFVSDENEMEHVGKRRQIDDFLRDQSIKEQEKLQFFQSGSHIKQGGCSDILLYELSGRYLWFCVVIASPERTCIETGTIYAEKENFLQIFPDIYRLPGTFLERYLSVFSSLYVDMAQQIERLPELIDIDLLDPENLKEILALISLDEKMIDILTKDQMLRLLRNLKTLILQKGTVQCIRTVTEMITGQSCNVVEHGRMIKDATDKESLILKKLYGESKNVFTVILEQPLSEKEFLQLSSVIDIVKPADTAANIVILRKNSTLDSYGYLDKNVYLLDKSEPKLGVSTLEHDSFII